MASRTYVPGLLFFAKLLLRYCRRWEEKIEKNLGTEALDLFHVLVDAANALVTLLENGEETP